MTQLGGQCTLRASQFSQHLALWVISNTAQRQSTVSADGSIQQKVNKTGTKCKSKKLTPAVKDKHELHVNTGRHYRSSPAAAAALNTLGLRCNGIRRRGGGRASSSHISNQHIFIKFDLTQSVTTLKTVTSSGDLTSRTLTCAPVLLRQACVLEETWWTVQADGTTEHTAVIQWSSCNTGRTFFHLYVSFSHFLLFKTVLWQIQWKGNLTDLLTSIVYISKPEKSLKMS